MPQTVLNKPIDPFELKNLDQLSNLKFQIFGCLWALASLFHMGNHRSFGNQLPLVLLTIAAVFLFIKPSSVFRFIGLVSIQLFVVFESMPRVSNHWLFTAFVNLTILSVFIFLVFKRKSFQINKKEFYQSFIPIVRIELIILYFFVVFHKLNEGFFSPQVSCASELYLSQNTYFFLPGTLPFLPSVAWFTIIIESLIPIFLCFRKTRLWGVFIGLVFHSILGFSPFNGFYDFSSMIFALYFLFMSDEFSHKIYALYKKVTDTRAKLKEGLINNFSLIRLFLLLGFFVCGSLLLLLLTYRFDDFFVIFWAIYSLPLMFVAGYIILSPKKNEKEDAAFFKVPHAGFLLLPLLVFLNGCSPYLGLKTENSFAMFSNLRTEGGKSNHFIVPSSFQIFDFQDDLIEIESSSDPALQWFVESGNQLVYYQFKAMVYTFKPESVTYLRNGKREIFNLAVAKANQDPILKEYPLLLRRLFRFRMVSKENPTPCSH